VPTRFAFILPCRLLSFSSTILCRCNIRVLTSTMEEICYADVVLTLFSLLTLCSHSSYCADSVHYIHLLCVDTTRVYRMSTSTWMRLCPRHAHTLLTLCSHSAHTLSSLSSPFVCRYYASVSYVDEHVGAIMSTLEGTGMAANTIVLFHADQ
jgi:membrane-anchored protein YejM (alkaline phosphatase superfamily)